MKDATRRDFLKTAAAGALGAPLLGFDRSSMSSHQPNGPGRNQRPNVVLIMVDDMGFADIGCYGGEIATPNLDRLASDGVRFSQFYNTSRCCPSRASLLTGLYSHEAGMGLMVHDRTEKPGFKGRLLHDRCVTIAQLMRDAGYGTYMTGKWHLGPNKGEQPLDWGFDRYYGCLDGAISYFEPGDPAFYPHDDDPRPITLDRTVVPPDDRFYATNRFTDYAKLFLDQHLNERGEDPFFLYMAPNAPHFPLQALPEDIAKYEGKYLKGWDKLREERYRQQLASNVLRSETTELTRRSYGRYEEVGPWPNSREPIPAWDSLSASRQKDFARRMTVYAAMIDNIDQNIGRLVNFLKDKGQFDNTILLFASDNGGAMVGGVSGFNGFGRHNPEAYGSAHSFINYGIGWSNASNTPFRLYKTYVHEGGISSPLIAHWPAGIDNAPGSFVRTPTHLIDIMPTLLEVAGARYPSRRNGHDILEKAGQSLVPLITESSQSFNTNRALYWEHAGCKAVRDRQWKLVEVTKGEWELYNMAEDRCETNNLISEHPERAARMKRMYRKWAKRSYVTPPMYK